MLPCQVGLQPAHRGSTLPWSRVSSLKLGEQLPHAGEAGAIIGGGDLRLEDRRRSWFAVGWFSCFVCLFDSFRLSLVIFFFLLVDSREDLFARLVNSLRSLANRLHVNVDAPEEDFLVIK